MDKKIIKKAAKYFPSRKTPPHIKNKKRSQCTARVSAEKTRTRNNCTAGKRLAAYNS